MKNTDLDNWTFTGGMKTEAGSGRIVPIHPCIQKIVKQNYEIAKKIDSPYLFNYINANAHNGNPFLTYSRYTKEFAKIRKTLNLNPNHRPHDGRKHFVTLAKKYKLDEYAIKYIVGHQISDITEKIYTQRDIDWLKSEMEKIK